VPGNKHLFQEAAGKICNLLIQPCHKVDISGRDGKNGLLIGMNFIPMSKVVGWFLFLASLLLIVWRVITVSLRVFIITKPRYRESEDPIIRRV
jgi:hypothetical protein